MKKSLIPAVAIGLLLMGSTLALAGAVKHGQDTTTTTTVTVNKSLDLTTGSIYVHGHGNFNGMEYFTALNGIAPAELLNSLISQIGNAQAAEQLAAIRNSASNPSVYEFLTANLGPSELAFNTGYGDSVQSPSSVTNIHDVGAIERATVGQRTASKSSSESSLGSFQVAVQGSQSTTSTESVGCFSFANSTTTVDVNGNVNVNAYLVTGQNYVSPIVLDMSGTGKLEASNGVYLPHPGHFDKKGARLVDYWGNGFPLLMEWVGPHDGLLVQPKADGSVDMSCIFSLQGGWSSGYEKLQAKDANGDLKLTGDELKGLAVWQDVNGNGVADPGEVKTLEELGITEINLNHQDWKSTFVINGKTQAMWDWWPSAMEVKKMQVSDLKAQETM